MITQGIGEVQDRAVRAVVAQMLGGACSPLAVLATGGSTSRTYRASVAGQTVVVKVNEDPEVLGSSTRNLQILRGLGIPVPHVLGYDGSRTRAPLAVLVLQALPGRDLGYELADMTAEQMTTLAAQIVTMQRSVATLPKNQGCGYVGIGEPATATWSQLVRTANARPLLDPLPAGVKALRERLEAALTAFEPYFQTVEPTCFLDDLTTKNVMVLDGKLTGVVDFDAICYGDRLFHLGLTAAAITADLPAHCQFYMEELLRLSGCDATARLVVTVYEAAHLTDFISRHPHTDSAVLGLTRSDGQGR